MLSPDYSKTNQSSLNRKCEDSSQVNVTQRIPLTIIHPRRHCRHLLRLLTCDVRKGRFIIYQAIVSQN